MIVARRSFENNIVTSYAHASSRSHAIGSLSLSLSPSPSRKAAGSSRSEHPGRTRSPGVPPGSMPLSARFRIARDFRFKRARSIVKYRLDREKMQTGIFHAGSESLRASSELDVSRGDRSRRALIGRNATRNTTGSLRACFFEGGARLVGITAPVKHTQHLEHHNF